MVVWEGNLICQQKLSMLDSKIASGDKSFQGAPKLEIICIDLIPLSNIGLCCRNANVKSSYFELIIANTLLVSWFFTFVSKAARSVRIYRMLVLNLVTWQECSFVSVIISLTSLNFDC